MFSWFSSNCWSDHDDTESFWFFFYFCFIFLLLFFYSSFSISGARLLCSFSISFMSILEIRIEFLDVSFVFVVFFFSFCSHTYTLFNRSFLFFFSLFREIRLGFELEAPLYNCVYRTKRKVTNTKTSPTIRTIGRNVKMNEYECTKKSKPPHWTLSTETTLSEGSSNLFITF